LSSLRGFNFDKEKLEILLGYWEQGQISQEDALDLERLLKPIYERAANLKDYETERQAESILISLKRFLNRVTLFENIHISDQVDIKKIVGGT
jgi:hypothetical protein